MEGRGMTDLLAARSQMAMSLAFHIIFAAIGIAMPALMVIAERRWQTTGDPVYLDLAKRWAKGTAILFAVGAVSGTVLSFELGLLWPGFMAYAGPIIGMPFSLEGFAFFTEAIFLGVYLYGWNRVSSRMHLLSGVLVAVSGAISAVFVVIANAWMNAPTGFDIVNGMPVHINPVAAMGTPAAFHETLHMVLAAYASTGFAVAGIHAYLLRKNPNHLFHRRAFSVALVIAIPAAILQPISGDLSAQAAAHLQPMKLAAMEGQFQTERGAPLRIGGLPDQQARVTRYAIEVPKMLSFLSYHDPDATVQGLETVPERDWPPVVIVHLAFQIMVALGTYLALVAVWAAFVAWRGRGQLHTHRALLAAIAIGTPFGFLAIEAGWTVTEVGRQPWIVQGFLRTANAVTPMPGLVIPFLTFTVLYLFLGTVVAILLYRLIRVSHQHPGRAGLPQDALPNGAFTEASHG
jgi:cytochrome d ubiquinol oxidase subunit I